MAKTETISLAKTEKVAEIVMRRDHSTKETYQGMDDISIKEGCAILTWKSPAQVLVIPVDQIASAIFKEVEIEEFANG